MWFAFLALVCLILCCYLSVSPLLYWSKKGVPFAKPLPFFGNMVGTVLGTSSVSEIAQDIYKSFATNRYVGFYLFLTPSFMIKDIELIKSLLIQHSETFLDHRDFVLQDVDPLWSSSLFALKVHGNWRATRASISPTFSTGKIRIMYQLVQQCAKEFTEYYGKQKDTIEVEFKNTISRITHDVIASTAFGYSCNSLSDSKNDFYLHSKDLTTFGGIMALKLFLGTLSPYLSRLLKIKMYSNRVSTFFRTVIKNNIKMRRETGFIRPDMIHILMEAKRGSIWNDKEDSDTSSFAVVNESEMDDKVAKSPISDEDIVAHALNFLIGGTDTLSTGISFVAYELALNIDVQNKLREEVDTAFKKCDNNITYDAIFEMKYLDMVISEGLRKWPPANQIERVIPTPFVIKPLTKDENPVYLDANTACYIPAYAIHRDPEYYPNPERYDPERFSEENRSKINKAAYFPFGVGPRNCIASRLALLVVKVVITEIIRNYELVPIAKTLIPMKLDPTSYTIDAKGGIWIGMNSRQI